MKKPGLFLRSSHDQLGVLIHPLGKQVQYLVQTHLRMLPKQALSTTKLRQHSGSPDAGRPTLKDEIMRHLQLGFSLLELMIALLLLAVLVAIGAPSLNSLYEGYRAQTGIKQVQQLLQFARNQAISYGVRVSVCALKDGRCEADAWQQGVTVFSDGNGNHVLDEDDKLLYQTGAFNSKDILKCNREAIRFMPDGLATGTNATFTYCPGRVDSPQSRALVINSAGRVRHSQDENIQCQNTDGV